jgi:hypothetical protein
MGETEEFVDCHIIETIEKDGVWIHQPKMLNNLKQIFKKLRKNGGSTQVRQIQRHSSSALKKLIQ